MHSHAVAIAGLWALAHAIPTPSVEDRGLGEPVTGICVDAVCVGKATSGTPLLVPGDFKLPPGFPTDLLPPGLELPEDGEAPAETELPVNTTSPEFALGGALPKRSPGEDKGKPKPKPKPKPEEPEVTKEDILEAEAKLAILEDLLDDADSPREKAALQQAIKQTKAFLKKHAGIISIEAPEGVTTTFVPGKQRRSPGGEKPKPKPKPKPEPEPEVTKEDILEAEAKLAILEDLLDDADSPREKAALQQAIKQTKAFLKKHAGIISIEAPEGVTTTFVPGKQRRSPGNEKPKPKPEPKPKPPHKPEPEPEVTKEDILEAEEKLAILEDLLEDADSPREKAALQQAIKQTKAFLKKHAGIISIEAPDGVTTTFVPGKQKRSPGNEKPKPKPKPEPKPKPPHKPEPEPEVSKEDILEAEEKLATLEDLLEKAHTQREKAALQQAIKQTKAFLKKHAGIIEIEAPEGVTTTFVPGKQKRGDDGWSKPKPKPKPEPPASKDEIAEAEEKLVILQNLLDNCIDEDEEVVLKLAIKKLKAFLKKEAGIISIEAPEGVGTTFVPGKQKRGDDGWSKPKPKPKPEPPASKEEIAEAEEKLVILQNLLDNCIDKDEEVALKLAIKKLKAFLKKEAGIVSIEAPEGVGTTFVPGKRSDDDASFKILGAYTKLTISVGKSKPSFATYLVLCELAGFLSSKGLDVDTTIINAWSTFSIADKVKRQDGIFALPGSCSPDEIIGLQFLLTTIQLVYGRNPPDEYKTLRNAVAAALQYCKVATPGVGQIVPEPTVPGGPLVPEQPVQGGPLVPETPVQGGPLVPETPVKGGPLVPETPVKGGPLVPEKPVEGAPLKPSD